MNLQILLIDDDSCVLRAVEIMLSDLGYDVVTARNGETGLRLFRSNPPDVVITDIIMPDKEGIETIIEMRRLRPDAKIIAISGGVGSARQWSLLDIAMKLGADQILSKPFDGEQLSGVIKAVLA